MSLPWVLGTIYWKMKFDADYEQPAGALEFSVIGFLIYSLISMSILICRRVAVKGELSGGEPIRTCTYIILVGL